MVIVFNSGRENSLKTLLLADGLKYEESHSVFHQYRSKTLADPYQLNFHAVCCGFLPG